MKKQKPKCKCGMDMIVIEYIGYYDQFKYWGFDKKCKCTKGIAVYDFEADKVIKGAYA